MLFGLPVCKSSLRRSMALPGGHESSNRSSQADGVSTVSGNSAMGIWLVTDGKMMTFHDSAGIAAGAQISPHPSLSDAEKVAEAVRRALA